MKFGICAPFAEITALRHISFDYLEENVQRFLLPEQPQAVFEDIWQAARKLPVPIEAANSFFPANLPLIATPTHQIDTLRLERYVKTALRRAEQVGIRVIVFGSGSARACPEGYARDAALGQLEEHLARWNAWAGEHGVEIVLEPLRYAETNLLHTVAEGYALVSRLASRGVSHIRLLADTYHMAHNAEDPETLLPCSTLLAHVHVAELAGRTAPGQHGENFRPYFSALQRGGYQRRISIECNWGVLAAEVDPAIATLREQWENMSEENINTRP